MCRQNPHKVQIPISITPPKQRQVQSPKTSSLRDSNSIQLSPTEKTNLLFSSSEITAATNAFQSPKLGNSSAWKCTLRGKTVVVSQRPFPNSTPDAAQFRAHLADLCKVRHAGIVGLIGAYACGSHMYLVHDFQRGADLAHCLRSRNLIGHTVLSKWIHRIRIGSDIAKALEYLHHDIPIRYVHKHVKSSGIIVSEPDFRAKLVHFGSHMLTCERHVSGQAETRRSGSVKISGTHGYMAPEYVTGGAITPKLDVYAFGVVLLELLTGEEAVRYVYEEKETVYRKISLVEGLGHVNRGLRNWVDGRMMDSYPLDCVERVVEIARVCVDSDPEKRPIMRWVSNELSRVLIMSEKWEEDMRGNDGITISLVVR
ncbi:lysM domain receptor-like kinase 3 [Magnolia sinica]|uniref:lysM domain receptor-like kinase 3 n=1 Tax=Magnolia sinica TaxID=86752 RepID=UPI002658166E|nr:lysM domain receptor-like kinase 3 [Magnolia sinica]